jgi:hypothetical protein
MTAYLHGKALIERTGIVPELFGEYDYVGTSFDDDGEPAEAVRRTR